MSTMTGRWGSLVLTGLALAVTGCSPAGNGPEDDVAAAPPHDPATADDTAPREARRPELMVGSEATEHAQGLYQRYCAECHEGGVAMAPHSVLFQTMGPEALLASMEGGVMTQQASPMDDEERRQLAEFLGGRPLGATESEPVHACAEDQRRPDFAAGPAMYGWGMTLGNTRFVDEPGFDTADVADLELKWSFAYPGATRARSQPLVAGDTVFVGSQDGTIYALDLATGCARWTYQAESEVRSSLSIDIADGRVDGDAPRVYFGDFDGWVYAVDARTGTEAWKSHIEDHKVATITGSPRLYRDRLYVPISSTEWASATDPAYECCTFRGAVAAFDTGTGEMLWKTRTIPEEPRETGETTSVGAAQFHPAGAPVWNSPTIDPKRNLLYVGTGQAYTSPAWETSNSIIAMDLDTGEKAWHWQAIEGDAWTMACFLGLEDNCPEEDGPDFDIGAPPALVTLSDGRDLLFVGQKSGHVYAIDPEANGEKVWENRIGLGGFAGGVHWGLSAEADVVYAPNADTDFIGKWEGERRPGVFALDAHSGETKWHTLVPNVCPEELLPACDPGKSAAATAIPGVVFAGGFDGILRAFDSDTGEVLWEYETHRTFETVSGEIAHGGSIESDGPVPFAGHLLVNSGYLFGGRMPGNVLLVFGPPDRED